MTSLAAMRKVAVLLGAVVLLAGCNTQGPGFQVHTEKIQEEWYISSLSMKIRLVCLDGLAVLTSSTGLARVPEMDDQCREELQ